MEPTLLPFSPERFLLASYPLSQTFCSYEIEDLVPQLRVLFLCKTNNARSQMAEALLRHLSHGEIEAYSAGSSPTARIHPFAYRAMEMVGIDMYEQYPKHFARYYEKDFDAVVTLCDEVQEICPTFPNAPKHIHWSIPDPVEAIGSNEDQYATFQQVGMQLTSRLRLLMTVLNRKLQGNF